jgi:CRISPR-associated protein Csb2
MFGVRVDLLRGVYAAADFQSRSLPEWPPHPFRLFNAMVAVAADPESGLAEDDRSALRWLESQPAPNVLCSDAASVATRAPVTHFVPVNDAAAQPQLSAHDKLYADLISAERALSVAEAEGAPKSLAKARTAVERVEKKARDQSQKWTEASKLSDGALKVLPAERMRQGRTFASCTPAVGTFYFVWPGSTPSPQVRARLEQLLERVARLGHSSSAVACSLLDEVPVPERLETLVPSEVGSMRLRTPKGGGLDELETAFGSGRPLANYEHGLFVTDYRSDHPETELPTSDMATEWVVLELRENDPATGNPGGQPRRERAPRPIAPESLLGLTQAVRASIINYAVESTVRSISGHEPDGQPTKLAHLAVVALPYVGTEHADGSFRHVALVMPEASADDLRLLRLAVGNWLQAGGKLYGRGIDARRVVEAPERGNWSANPQRWTKPSHLWASATPIVLKKFPGELFRSEPGKRKRAWDAASKLVAESCVDIGLPEPVGVRLDRAPMIQGARRSEGYQRFRREGGRPSPPQVHAMVEFDQPVQGPVLLGSGRYLGYGLMAPVDAAQHSAVSATDRPANAARKGSRRRSSSNGKPSS